MKRYFFILLALTIACTTLCSCEKKKVDTPEVFEGIYYDERTTDREYFEKVTTEVLSYIRPGNQQTTISTLALFSQYCRDYEFPEEFGSRALADAADDLADAIAANDYPGVSRAVTTLAFSFYKLTGLYQAQPDDSQWHFIESRDDLDFKFYRGTQEYNLVLTGLGDTWSAGIDVDDISLTFDVPKVIDVRLTNGPNTSTNNLLTAKIQSEYRDASSLSINTSVRFADIQLDTTINGSQTRVTDELTVYEHNPSTMVRTLIMQSSTQLSGSNLCSLSAWQKALTSADPERETARMFSGGSITLMLYKSIQIKANLRSLSASLLESDMCWTSKDDADKAAAELASALTAELRYCSDDSQKLRGVMGWQSYIDDDVYGDSPMWSVRPTLKFTSDGATYDFSSFFGNNRFLSVQNTLQSMVNSYSSYWK